MPLDPLRS